MPCIRDRHWRALCALLARPDLYDDLGLADGAGRVARMDEVNDAVAAWTSGRPMAAMLAELNRVGVPAAPVRTLAEVVHDPEVRAGGALRAVGVGDRAGLAFGSPFPAP